MLPALEHLFCCVPACCMSWLPTHRVTQLQPHVPAHWRHSQVAHTPPCAQQASSVDSAPECCRDLLLMHKDLNMLAHPSLHLNSCITPSCRCCSAGLPSHENLRMLLDSHAALCLLPGHLLFLPQVPADDTPAPVHAALRLDCPSPHAMTPCPDAAGHCCPQTRASACCSHSDCGLLTLC